MDGVITRYLYSNEGLIAEYDNNGNIQKTYGWMPNGVWGTDPLYMTQNNQTYIYHNDALGTPQKMTDASALGGGTVVWSATYTAFGEATINPSSTITNNLRFAGQYFDQETGTHYNLFRVYDPKTGTYISKDPIGFEAGDTNLYRYVFNSPVNYTDPLGLAGPAALLAPLVTIEAAKDIVIIGGLTAAYLYFTSPEGKAIISKTAEDLVKDIEEWEKKRDEELKKCKTSLGQPEFPGPKQEPPKDFKMKVALVISQLLKLLNQIEKLILKH